MSSPTQLFQQMWKNNLSERNLSGIKMESGEIKDLFQFILLNMVSTLDLLCQDLSEDISEALQKNQTLTRLSLFHNQIEDKNTKIGDTVKNLSDVLQKNKTLKTINLNYNEIGDIGVKCLIGGLQKIKL